MDHKHRFEVVAGHPFNQGSEKIWFFCVGCGSLCARHRKRFYSTMLKKKPKRRLFGRKNK